MEEHYYTEEKPLLIAIDVGIVNMGICIADYTRVINGISKIPQFEFMHRSLLETQDGKVYKEYEEGIATELVYNFLHDHWAKYFGRAFLVLIEKQMCSPGAITAKERACLTVENSLKTFLYAEISTGGPRFYIIAPTTWKRQFGLVEERKEEDKKRATSKNVNPFRLRHKDASRDMFFKIINENKDPYFKAVLEVYGRAITTLTTDQIEAFFIVNYYIKNAETVWDASLLRSHHSASLTKAKQEITGTVVNTKKRLTKNDRVIDIQRLSDIRS